MNDALRRIRAIFELELDVSFPFPSAEALSIILATLTALYVVMQGFVFSFILFPPSSVWGYVELERTVWSVEHADLSSLSMPIASMMLLLIALIPLLSAFRVAGPIESGVLRAMLSYPIRRRRLLILKGLQITLLTCLPITVGALAAVALYNALSIGVESFWVLVSLWSLAFAILSSSFLLSVITRSSAKAAIGGMAVWFTLLIVALFSHLPVIFRGILNPVNLAINYFTGTNMFGYVYKDAVFGDVLLSIIGTFLIGVVTFLLSIKFFDGVEL